MKHSCVIVLVLCSAWGCSAAFSTASEDRTDGVIEVDTEQLGVKYTTTLQAFQRGEWQVALPGFEEVGHVLAEMGGGAVQLDFGSGCPEEFSECSVGLHLFEHTLYYQGTTLNRLGQYGLARAKLGTLLRSVPTSVPVALVALELSVSEAGLGDDAAARKRMAPYLLTVISALQGNTDLVLLQQYEKLLGQCVLPIPVQAEAQEIDERLLLRDNQAGLFWSGMSMDEARRSLPEGWELRLMGDAPEGSTYPVFKVFDSEGTLQLVLWLDGPFKVSGIEVVGGSFQTQEGLRRGLPLSEAFQRLAPTGCGGSNENGVGVKFPWGTWLAYCPYDSSGSESSAAWDIPWSDPRTEGDPCVCKAMADAGCALGWLYLRDERIKPFRRLSAEERNGMALLCAQLEGCKKHGECSYGEYGCAVASTDDCRKSVACKEYGKCALIDGYCKKPSACAARYQCKNAGNCTWMDGACRPGSNRDCSKTPDCKEDGKCTYLKGRGCILAKTADCRRSSGCRSDGECTYSRKGRCVVASNSDCRRSEDCKALGYCYSKDGRCVQEWDVLSRREKTSRSLAQCRRIMSKISSIKRKYIAATRKGDDETRWKLQESIDDLDTQFQEVADRLNSIMMKMQEEGVSEGKIRKFARDVQRDCSL